MEIEITEPYPWNFNQDPLLFKETNESEFKVFLSFYSRRRITLKLVKTHLVILSNLKKDGTYPADVKGDLTIHGVTKSVTTKGTIVVSGKVIAANAAFTVQVADYGITGQGIDAGKVSKEPKITVAIEFK